MCIYVFTINGFRAKATYVLRVYRLFISYPRRRKPTANNDIIEEFPRVVSFREIIVRDPGNRSVSRNRLTLEILFVLFVLRTVVKRTIVVDFASSEYYFVRSSFGAPPSSTGIRIFQPVRCAPTRWEGFHEGRSRDTPRRRGAFKYELRAPRDFLTRARTRRIIIPRLKWTVDFRSTGLTRARDPNSGPSTG